MTKYRKEVLRTAASYFNGDVQKMLTNGALGLAGESGEVVDLIKKHLFHGRALDRAALILELGDVLWYVELLCHALDVPTKQVIEKNVAKLRARYPEGFKAS